MKTTTIVFIALAAGIAGVTGCAAAPAQQQDAPVAASAQGLTVDECATQQTNCFAQYPLFGLFTCPAQYAQCLATASNGIPAQVTAAITDAEDCAKRARACRIETPDRALGCTEDEATCIAAIVGAKLPPIVTGTAACAEDSVVCIRAAKSAADLATCSRTFQGCAFDQAVSALPPEVGTVVKDIGDCLGTLRTCTGSATSASAVTECSQDEISCVAGSFGVSLPQPPVAEAIHCAETAADCGLHATTPAAVRTCAASFTKCNADLATAQLTCAQKWTACLARNPFNFVGCTADFSVCTDG